MKEPEHGLHDSDSLVPCQLAALHVLLEQHDGRVGADHADEVVEEAADGGAAADVQFRDRLLDRPELEWVL
jgi:hypothetical protein